MITAIDTPDLWRENALKGCADDIAEPTTIVGTSLLDSVSPFYKKLFSSVLKRVHEGKSTVVAWRYCADSPGMCRHFMLWVIRQADGSIVFSSTQLDEHLRQPVFEEGFADSDTAAVEICGWCQKLKHRDGTKWQSPDTFHAAMASLGVAPPRSLHAKHVACESCAKELAHNGMSWVPYLPRAVTDTHSRLTVVCVSTDSLLLRELTVRICATRPWHAVSFPVTPPEDKEPDGTIPMDSASLPVAHARECVRVFVTSNPACAAIATDDGDMAMWFRKEGGVCWLRLYYFSWCISNTVAPFIFPHLFCKPRNGWTCMVGVHPRPVMYQLPRAVVYFKSFIFVVFFLNTNHTARDASHRCCLR